MKYAPGAPMNLTAAPPGWQVTFTADGESWTEPVIGWAVVATVSGQDGIDSDIATIVLDSDGGYAETLSSYLNSRSTGVSQRNDIKYSIEYRHPGA